MYENDGNQRIRLFAACLITNSDFLFFFTLVAQLATTDDYFVSSSIVMDNYVFGLAFDGNFMVLATVPSLSRSSSLKQLLSLFGLFLLLGKRGGSLP